MAYNTTRRKSRVNAQCRAMRKGKALKQEERAKELGPRVEHELPVIRKIVVVLSLDFGLAAEKMGWTVFCKRLSAYYPRLLNPMNLE